MPVQRLRLEIDASPAYEFVLSLAAATAGGSVQAPRSLLDAARSLAGSCDMVWAHLLTVAYDTAPPRDVAALLAAVRAMHPRELRLRLLGYYVRYFRRATAPEVIAAAAGGDQAAAELFIATSYPDDPRWQGALAALLPLDGWETRRRLLAVLAQWQRWFATVYDPQPLSAEVAVRRGQARSMRPEQLVAAVMDGWEYVPEPGITAVLLIPSRVIWPAVHVLHHHSTKLICYPVGPASAPDLAAPPLELVAAGQALGDERRLRILRLLGDEDLTAQQIASRLGVGLTTLLHHLGLLREAGLVAVSDRRRKVYRLQRGAVAGIGPGLERFLLG